MNSLRTSVFLLALAAALLLAPPQAASDPVRVRMGLPSFGVNAMPYLIAMEKGFYREEGLQVDFILMTGLIAVAATVAGEIEFNGTAPSSVGAAMQGAPLKVVLVLSRKPKYWIFGKPEIRSLNELAGRVLGTGSRGGDQHVQTLLLLDQFGLSGKVRVLPMAGAPAQANVESLLAGRIDAGYANESTYFTMKERGFRELVNYADHLETLSAGLATAQRLIDAKPDLVQAFVGASYRGMTFFKERRSESIDAMARTMKLDDKSAARIYDLVIGTFGGDGTAPYAQVKKELEARKNILNLAGAVPSYDELFDDRFARRLQKPPKSGVTP